MVKTLITGLWAIVVTLGAFYGAMLFRAGSEARIAPKEIFASLEQLKTEVISVPMISEGRIEGYVLARFVYLMDAEKRKKLAIDPGVILTDEAFRIIYASPVRDFQRIEKYDLSALTEKLKKNVNRRLGGELVKDVLVDSINYVARSEIRYKGLKQ